MLHTDLEARQINKPLKVIENGTNDQNKLYCDYFDNLNAQYQMNLQTQLQLEQLMLEQEEETKEMTKEWAYLLSLVKSNIHNTQMSMSKR